MNPTLLVEQFFKATLWSKQIEVLDAIAKEKRVAVKSGNAVGKSFLASIIALWFLMSHYPSKVITTAPTWNQIENILWKEIANLYNKSVIPMGGDLLKAQLKFNEEWFAIGISTDEVNRFQGFHSPYLLVIVDEALGVDPIIWEAIKGLKPYKVLAIGNPLSPEGEFYKCFSSELWKCITISGQDCVKWQNDNVVIPGLVDQDWINECRIDWGEKSALYQARVLGEFPTEGTNLLISPKWVDQCYTNKLEEYADDEVKVISTDVATKRGENSTVILYRYGHTIKEIDEYKQIPTTMTTTLTQRKYEDKRADSIVIDSDGVGEGVADMLKQKNIGHYEFHGGYAHKAMDKHRFRNLRSQFFWIIAKKFEKGLYDLSFLPEKVFIKLRNQLCSMKLKAPDGLGRIQVETKDDMHKRGIVSPDLADAFMMSEYAFFMGRQGDIKPYRWR